MLDLMSDLLILFHPLTTLPLSLNPVLLMVVGVLSLMFSTCLLMIIWSLIHRRGVVLQMLHLHLYTYAYSFLTQLFSSFKPLQQSALCLNTASLFHAVHDSFTLTHWLNLFPIYRHSLLISTLLPFYGCAHPLSLTQSDSH